MTAPGKYLDFFESAFYASKVAPAKVLANEIAEYLKSWPNHGTLICGGVRELSFVSKGQEYVVIFRRVGQKLYLMNIFEIPSDAIDLKAYRVRVRKDFGGLF